MNTNSQSKIEKQSAVTDAGNAPRGLPDDAQDVLAKLICEYTVRDVLETISDVMIEIADGDGEIGFEPDEQTMRDDAAIVAHAAAHVKG